VDGGEVGGEGGITAAAVMGTDIRERAAMSVFPYFLDLFLFLLVTQRGADPNTPNNDDLTAAHLIT
jgi:hypothetical protein